MQDAQSLCEQVGQDPRFGCYDPTVAALQPVGNVMGNVLSDYRAGKQTLAPVESDLTFHFEYYRFEGDDDPHTMDFLPGEFGYRAYDAQHFILFAYGGPYFAGMDFLNKEKADAESRGGVKGLPDAVFRTSEKTGLLEYGNPDGRPDGIIVVYNQDGKVAEYDVARELFPPAGARQPRPK